MYTANNGNSPDQWHGTTILSIRKDDQVVIAGDGQVTLGNTVIKATARKVRQLGDGADATSSSTRPQASAVRASIAAPLRAM